MPVIFKSVLIPHATCDVCGAEALSFYTTFAESRPLTVEEDAALTDGALDPRVRLVLCMKDSDMGPKTVREGETETLHIKGGRR